MNQFRKKHIFEILEGFSKTEIPLDGFIANYLRKNKSIGSKDRVFITDAVYGIIRWQGLLDHVMQGPISWGARMEAYFSSTLETKASDAQLPPHIQVSFPKYFYDLLSQSLGEMEARQFCLNSNFAAPTTIRVNPIKISRDELFERWKSKYDISITPLSPFGIRFHRKTNFYAFEEFHQGDFEIQDEGSQIVANMLEAKPGDLVLDYCAGAGGKTLGFAHKLEKKGQIYLHDVRAYPLAQAKKRLKRAGIQNAQTLTADSKQKNSLKGKMDWVFADVPCSGSGTLRRNPDRKWKFRLDELKRLISLQRTIFQEALEFVKPGGKLVYATCSVLPQENEEQAAYFLKEFSLICSAPAFRSLPVKNGMDGFFGIILQKPL
jgi:16S rRNA (cytosine967-C5)-methyltransferase